LGQENGGYRMDSRADLSLKQTIGPKTMATAQMARHWLSQVAAKQGFDNINIVVERPTYET
jgi:hypothetical protein